MICWAAPRERSSGSGKSCSARTPISGELREAMTRIVEHELEATPAGLETVPSAPGVGEMGGAPFSTNPSCVVWGGAQLLGRPR